MVFPRVGLEVSSSKGRNKVSAHGEKFFVKHEENIPPATTRQRNMDLAWSGAYLGGG